MPPELTIGSSYEKKEVKRPPVDLESSLEHFEKSEFMQEVFGKEAHRHYADFYANEVVKNEENISSWEKKRYLDLI